MSIKEILKNSIDLHVHIGPEIVPRKFSLPQLVNYERGKLKAVAVKNHFFPTIFAESNLNLESKPAVIYSVSLNNSVGGLNPEVVRASAQLSPRPLMVWFPTIHAKNFLDQQDYEVASEWVDNKKVKKETLRSASEVKGLTIFSESGEVKQKVIEILKVIKKYSSVLATGHLSWKESKSLIETATEQFGLKKIIITHPVYQKIDMPLEVQKELTKKGAFVEVSYSMYSIDKIPIEKLVEQIKHLGAESCILTSDVGQTFSKSPSESLADFVALLKSNDLSDSEIEKMLVTNPGYLISNAS